MLNTVARVKHLSSKDIKECMRTSTPTDRHRHAEVVEGVDPVVL